MKSFHVTVPFTGYAVRTIEAESEEEAIQKFINESTLNMAGAKSETDAEIQEWSFHEKVLQGNIFHGMMNEAEAVEE